MKQAQYHYMGKYLNAWKEFIKQCELEAIQKEQQRRQEQKLKQIYIEKEKKKRLNELAEQACEIRNITLLKSCFEGLKTQLEIKRTLEFKYNEFRNKLDNKLLTKTWKCIMKTYKISQKDKQ